MATTLNLHPDCDFTATFTDFLGLGIWYFARILHKWAYTFFIKDFYTLTNINTETVVEI